MNQKALSEYTKREIHWNVRFGAKEMRELQVPAHYDYGVCQDYFAIDSVYKPFLQELERRGMTATDRRIAESYYLNKFKTGKAIDRMIEIAG